MNQVGRLTYPIDSWTGSIASIGWILAAILLVVSGVLLFRSLRERQQKVKIMVRLDELEERLAEVAGLNLEHDHLPAEEKKPTNPAFINVPTPSGDVLAGHTTAVRRIVTSVEGQALEAQAIRCIHNHLEHGITPQTLAESLHVSLRTLERGLLHALECTPRQLILAMKMREARRLLASGQCRVKDVALTLGFSDQYHFSRCFKAFYRVTPSDARQKSNT